MSQKYFGDWTSRNDVMRAFDRGDARWDSKVKPDVPNFPAAQEILLAYYEVDGYEGTAFVLYQQGNRLYEVNASHCSCHGLEGQWEPEATTWKALNLRSQYLPGNAAAQVRLLALIAKHTF